MGGHTNYVVQFVSDIDWDEHEVRRLLSRRYPSIDWLYLRDTPKPTLVLVVYSNTKIEDVLRTLQSLYGVEATIREFTD